MPCAGRSEWTGSRPKSTATTRKVARPAWLRLGCAHGRCAGLSNAFVCVNLEQWLPQGLEICGGLGEDADAPKSDKTKKSNLSWTQWHLAFDACPLALLPPRAARRAWSIGAARCGAQVRARRRRHRAARVRRGSRAQAQLPGGQTGRACHCVLRAAAPERRLRLTPACGIAGRTSALSMTKYAEAPGQRKAAQA